jgi:hypothetical protein
LFWQTRLAGDDQSLQRQVYGQACQQNRRQRRMCDVVFDDEIGEDIAAALVRRQDQYRTRCQRRRNF